jgi:hypothetical protein
MSNRKGLWIPSAEIASFHLTHGEVTRLDSWSHEDRTTACALLAQIAPHAMTRILGPGILDQIIALVAAKGPHSHKGHWRKVGRAIEELLMSKDIAIDDIFYAIAKTLSCEVPLYLRQKRTHV